MVDECWLIAKLGGIAYGDFALLKFDPGYLSGSNLTAFEVTLVLLFLIDYVPAICIGI